MTCSQVGPAHLAPPHPALEQFLERVLEPGRLDVFHSGLQLQLGILACPGIGTEDAMLTGNTEPVPGAPSTHCVSHSSSTCFKCCPRPSLCKVPEPRRV